MRNYTKPEIIVSKIYSEDILLISTPIEPKDVFTFGDNNEGVSLGRVNTLFD